MARVRQEGTSAEIAVRKILDDLDIEYEVNVKDLPGSPDLVNSDREWAIFVHGCFWHAHEGCSRWKIPSKNREYWEEKFERNKERDKQKLEQLVEIDYSVLVVWECELGDKAKLENRIRDFLYPVEKYVYSPSKKSVTRTVYMRSGEKHSTRLFMNDIDTKSWDARAAFDMALLRRSTPPPSSDSLEFVRCVDLFSGCGGLSLGVSEACIAIGKKFLPIAALDKNPIALDVYERNFKGVKRFGCDVWNVIDGDIGSEVTVNEQTFLKDVLPVNICISGPPCQGYSDLNNYTRRKDPKNELYLRVARFIEITVPEHVLIENVPRVIHGKGHEVQKTLGILKDLGYHVDDAIVDLSSLGVPQKRKRHVLIGSLSKKIKIHKIMKKYEVKQKTTTNWAIKDLENVERKNVFDETSKHMLVNKKRIQFLIDNELYDLPNYMRPFCHQNEDHSYKSMYGRMKPDEPAQTITSGYGSPGQGRFIHPTRPSTITPHEAARLQFFPDYFDFSSVNKRTKLAEMIGNAVPVKLSYVFCIELLA